MLQLDHVNLLSLPPFAAAGVGYMLGALPFGYWVGKAHGINIFDHGSKNPGATNVRRVLGSKAGNVTFVLDALKGALAAAWPLYFVWQASRGPNPTVTNLESAESLRQVCGAIGLVAAMLGHSYSCFTGFRGGKGVATVAGGFLVLMPLVALASAALWTAVFFLTRYVSLASILSAAFLPLAARFLSPASVSVWVAAILGAFVIIRHRANIMRLYRGTENRFDRKPPRKPGDDSAHG